MIEHYPAIAILLIMVVVLAGNKLAVRYGLYRPPAERGIEPSAYDCAGMGPIG